MRRTALASALAIVACLAAVPAAGAARPARLLAKYQPVLELTPGEQLRPASATTFAEDAELRFLNAFGTTVPALDLPGCTPATGLSAVACYDAADDAAPTVVYGRVAEDGDATIVQYWFFWYDNFYSYAYPPTDDLWQAHEGEWEGITIVLSPGGEPRYVGYHQHCSGEVRSWSETPRWNGHHPVVHVAIGSHASYFETGTHPFNRDCIPAPVQAFFQQAGLPFPVDYVGDGELVGPARLDEDVAAVERITDTSPSWMTFPGIWGELEYFHAPQVGTQAAGVSPVGPAFHDVWRDPVATLDEWRAG